jgi:simple sugar transport system ATP-binding protein
MTPLLELVGISKRYGELVANVDVSLMVQAGSIHALLGENGAGKSTLMKIIYGLTRPDTGSVRWQGQPIALKSPDAARALGISMVFQHFALFEAFSIAENVWLGAPRGMALAEVIARIGVLSREYGLALDPARPMHTLSVGEKQRVEIVRALLIEPKLLILDEPTSVLTPSAIEALFGTLRKLAARGAAIIYISHKLGEIRALCDRCSVLRKGRIQAEVDPRSESEASLARLMLGSEPPALETQRSPSSGCALRVSKLDLPRSDEHGVDLREISFALARGEILGIAGMSGSGQAALLAALSGEDTRAAPGSVQLFDQDISRLGPVARRARGLRVIPEERLGRGLVPSFSLADNTLLTCSEGISPRGFLRPSQIAAHARRLIDKYRVKAESSEVTAGSLSGGNVQKFLVGRELDALPRVLVVAQPTWGVDAGAARDIRGHLLTLREQGAAILLISEDLDELFALSDRLCVMAQGRLSVARAVAASSVLELGALMAGPAAPGFSHA